MWIALFTCMSTCALHLEVVADNSAAQFLLAFRGYMPRKGAPDIVLSDNAPTFKLGGDVLVNELNRFKDESLIQEFTSRSGLKWRFITPFSPWKGGFYERLVGLVKSALIEATHRQTMDLWNLQTLLSEIEATLNTRPLTPLNTSPEEEVVALRPIDLFNPQFCLGHINPSNTGITPTDYVTNAESHEHLISYYTLLRSSIERFWEAWHTDYLQALADRNLQRSRSKQGSNKAPRIGDVVLIKQSNTTRSSWPLAIIVQLNSTADGSIRSVRLRTGRHRLLDRSMNQLVPLEVRAQDEIAYTNEIEAAMPTRFQPPRQAKNSRAR